jgi:hypothetical protein
MKKAIFFIAFLISLLAFEASAQTKSYQQALHLLVPERISVPRFVTLTIQTPDSTTGNWATMSIDTIQLEKPGVAFATEWDSTQKILTVKVVYRLNKALTITLLERIKEGEWAPKEFSRALLSQPVNPLIWECWVPETTSDGLKIRDIIECQRGNQSKQEQDKKLILKTITMEF